MGEKSIGNKQLAIGKNQKIRLLPIGLCLMSIMQAIISIRSGTGFNGSYIVGVCFSISEVLSEAN
jgi:hypothetical protein